MPQKFCLNARKNQWRNKYRTSLPLSIPLTNVVPQEQQPSELTISFPTSYFTYVSIPTLNELHSRLTTLNLIQNGWTLATSNSEVVTLCDLHSHSSAATPFVDFTMKVIQDLTWSLYFFDQMIERDACDVLAGIPNSLVSPANVVKVMDVVNNSDLCIGNPDVTFMPLLTCCNWVFMNRDGDF